MHRHLKITLPIATLIALILIVFAQTTTFSYVDYDDPAFITENPHINRGLTPSGIKWAITYSGTENLRAGTQNLWHPLTWASHMLDHTLFGKNYHLHHLTNLLLHTLATTLLFLIAKRLTLPTLAAFLTAALFAIHPLHTETVAWLSDRKGLLSTALMLASLLTYLSNKPTQKKASIALFILALLAKPTVVILPALLILIDLHRKNWNLQTTPINYLKAQLKTKSPYWLPALAITAITLYLKTQGTQTSTSHSLLQALQNIPAQLAFYTQRTLIPTHLNYHYTQTGIYTTTALSIAATLTIAALIFLAIKSKPLRVPLLWAAICFLPVSGLIHVGTSFTTDRYTYLILIGPFLYLAQIITKIPNQKIQLALTLAIITPLTILAHNRTADWKNSTTLHTAAYKNQLNDFTSLTNFATLKLTQNQIPQAIELLNLALTKRPQDPFIHHNLGIAHTITKNPQKALHHHTQATIANPNFTKAWLKIATLLTQNPNLKTNITRERALTNAAKSSNFTEPTSLLNLAALKLSQGNTKSATDLINLPAIQNLHDPKLIPMREKIKKALNH